MARICPSLCLITFFWKGATLRIRFIIIEEKNVARGLTFNEVSITLTYKIHYF